MNDHTKKMLNMLDRQEGHKVGSTAHAIHKESNRQNPKNRALSKKKGHKLSNSEAYDILGRKPEPGKVRRESLDRIAYRKMKEQHV